MSTPDNCPFCGASRSDPPYDAEFACHTFLDGDDVAVRGCHCYEHELAALRSQLDSARHRAGELVGINVSNAQELAALREQNAALLMAIRAALNELGVPQPGYPAPVVNAVELLTEALKP